MQSWLATTSALFLVVALLPELVAAGNVKKQVGEVSHASLAQLAEHALRKRMVVGSIPTGGFFCV